MPVLRLGLLVGMVFVAGTLRVSGQSPLRMDGWADEPSTVARSGQGVDLFRLWADVTWDRAGAARAGRLAIRVVGPGGQASVRAVESGEAGSGRRLAVDVPAAWVRNLRPEAVAVDVAVVEESTGRAVAGPLRAGPDAFPRPRGAGPPADPGPFGWGRPLDGPPGAARAMQRAGPDGWRFARVPATADRPGFFLATAEATNRQVQARLPGYDPRAGRSDDFVLDDPDQPAVGLSPHDCEAYLAALRRADPDGPAYRLPTRAEWLLAARAGGPTAHGWGVARSHADANLLGDEPALPGDTTAPARPGPAPGGFRANPWGFFHMVGNVEEWAVDPSGGFARLGGHFRTEPAGPLPDRQVADPRSRGPDPFVGLRPAFDLDAGRSAAAIGRALAADPRLASVTAGFDPDRATATLAGALAEPAGRRLADARVATLWWVEAVVDRIETPRFAAGELARLGAVAGPARRVTPLGRTHYEVPVAVRWAEVLPVEGSEWWVNLYPPGGGHESHRMIEGGPDGSGRVTVVVDRARMLGAGLAVDAPASVAMSLGGPAATADDTRVVSNVAPLRWKAP